MSHPAGTPHVCSVCGRRGHNRRRCPKATRCGYCHTKGHNRRTCFKQAAAVYRLREEERMTEPTKPAPLPPSPLCACGAPAVSYTVGLDPALADEANPKGRETTVGWCQKCHEDRTPREWRKPEVAKAEGVARALSFGLLLLSCPCLNVPNRHGICPTCLAVRKRLAESVGVSL